MKSILAMALVLAATSTSLARPTARYCLRDLQGAIDYAFKEKNVEIISVPVFRTSAPNAKNRRDVMYEANVLTKKGERYVRVIFSLSKGKCKLTQWNKDLSQDDMYADDFEAAQGASF